MSNDFNKTDIYKEILEEKILEIKRLCHREKMPVFISVCVKNDENETIYEKEMVSAATCELKLKDDQIAKMVNVTLGFDTIQPTGVTEIEAEDLIADTSAAQE